MSTDVLVFMCCTGDCVLVVLDIRRLEALTWRFQNQFFNRFQNKQLSTQEKSKRIQAKHAERIKLAMWITSSHLFPKKDKIEIQVNTKGSASNKKLTNANMHVMIYFSNHDMFVQTWLTAPAEKFSTCVRRTFGYAWMATFDHSQRRIFITRETTCKNDKQAQRGSTKKCNST